MIKCTDPIPGTHGIEYPSSHHCKVIRASKINIEKKPKEVPVVEVPDAVVYPRTVVV